MESPRNEQDDSSSEDHEAWLLRHNAARQAGFDGEDKYGRYTEDLGVDGNGPTGTGPIRQYEDGTIRGAPYNKE